MKKRWNRLITAGVSLLMTMSPAVIYAESNEEVIVDAADDVAANESLEEEIVNVEDIEESEETEEGYEETEPNDSSDSANNLLVNSRMNGTLSSSSDNDWYHFTLSEDGYVWMDFGHTVKLDNYTYWNATIYNSNMDQVINRGFTGSTLSTSTSKVGLPAGEYYLKIEDGNYNSDPYWFVVNFTTSSDWEKELNNSQQTVNELSVNKQMNGSLTNSNDDDWYHFTLAENGYIWMDFGHTSKLEDRYYWNATIYNSNMDQVINRSFKGETLSTSTSKVGLPAGEYYLKMTDSDWSNTDSYWIMVNFVASNDWEKELNNSQQTLNELSVNKQMNGSLTDSNDDDWYHFTLAEDGYIWMDFGHTSKLEDRYYWNATVYNSNMDQVINRNFKGATLSASTSKVGLPAGEYYLKMTDSDWSNTDSYSITVKFSAANDWEQELNNTQDDAQTITVNKTINGGLVDSNDLDWYTTTLSEDGYIWLDFKHGSDLSNSRYWQVILYNSNFDEVFNFYVCGDENWVQTEKVKLSAGQYYLKISDYYFSDAQYSFSINYSSKSNPQVVSMYRLYNPNSGEHFYTAQAGEKDHLVSLGWKYEGEGWKAPDISDIPVYRLYNPNAGDHHYTTSGGERDSLVNAGWKYEGIGWYSATNDKVPLYREYNPNAKAGSHNYTTNKAEHDNLIRHGWKDEGIAWYGL